MRSPEIGNSRAASESPSANATSTGACAAGAQLASGHSAMASRIGQASSRTFASRRQRPAVAAGSSAASAVPPSTSGSSTKLKTGTATAFTAGATSEMRPNETASTGARSVVIASCARANPPACPRQPTPCVTTASSAAVATNDSQKPAEVSASGSQATRMAAAAAKA